MGAGLEVKQPMNILFVLPAYEPAWAFGGVVRSTSSLCRGLAALGHRVSVYTINADGHGHLLNVPHGEVVNQGGVNTFFFPSTFGPKSIWDSRALVRRLRQTAGDFDLIYVSAIWQWLGVSVASICYEKHVPLVVSTRGSLDKFPLNRHWLRKWIYWHIFLKRAMMRAGAIHFTTEFEKREASAFLPPFPSFIVPNSFIVPDSYVVEHFRPLKHGREEFRKKLGIALDPPLVITVARADPLKRVDLLIKALSLVPEINLLVVGPGSPLTERWKTLAQDLGVANRVFWAGYLEGEELVKAYCAADLFSLISEHENFGMVVIEAMACGLPILTNSAVAVSEELKEENVGMIVEKNPEAIAQGMVDFLHHRVLWSGRGENSVRVAGEFFTNDKVAALTARAFEDMLTGDHTPACRWTIPPTLETKK